jgi:hypothetical protein
MRTAVNAGRMARRNAIVGLTQGYSELSRYDALIGKEPLDL